MLTAAETDLVLASRSQVQDLRSDITARWEVKSAANFFKDERAARLDANKIASVRKFQPELDATQTLPGPALLLNSAVLADSFYTRCAATSFQTCDRWCGRVSSTQRTPKLFWRTSALGSRFLKESPRATQISLKYVFLRAETATEKI